MFFLVLVQCGAAPAPAGLPPLEAFDGQRHFETRWTDGQVSLGGNAKRSWVEIQSAGGAGTFVANREAYQPSFDARGKFLELEIQVEDPSRLSGLELRLSSDGFARSHYAFPLPFYTDPNFDVLVPGEWAQLSFSFGAARVVGKPDRSALDSVGLYLTDTGEPARVRWSRLALVDEAPEGLLSMTFDDGYDEHFGAAQEMARHGFRGTAYVIPNAVGKPDYLRLSEVIALRSEYGWDVAAHHETPFTDLSGGALEQSIVEVQRFIHDTVPDAGGELHLAYPLGRQDARVREVVREHFTTARVAAEGPETLPPSDRHLLRIFNVLDTTTPKELAAAARRAQEHKEWLILMFHRIVTKPESDLDYGVKDFKRALEAIAGTGIRVLPVSEVWAACETSHCAVPASLPAASQR